MGKLVEQKPLFFYIFSPILLEYGLFSCCFKEINKSALILKVVIIFLYGHNN